MKRHLSPVAAAVLILLFSGRNGHSQEAPSVPANRVPADIFIARTLFSSDLSVVGSHGIFYRARHDFGILSLGSVNK
jgi:hypothetical protein